MPANISAPLLVVSMIKSAGIGEEIMAYLGTPEGQRALTGAAIGGGVGGIGGYAAGGMGGALMGGLGGAGLGGLAGHYWPQGGQTPEQGGPPELHDAHVQAYGANKQQGDRAAENLFGRAGAADQWRRERVRPNPPVPGLFNTAGWNPEDAAMQEDPEALQALLQQQQMR